MSPKRTYIQPGHKLELDLTPVERKTILDDLTLLPPEYEVMLKKVHPEQPLLLTLDELEDFSGYVAAESNHTTKKKLRTILDTAYEKIAVLLDTFTDEKPPVKKRTKKALAAEQAETERQQKISEQAVFLATWAAAVLQAAEQKGAKHKRLESFIPEHLDRVVLSTLPSVRSELQQRMEAGKEEFTLAEVGGMLMAVAEELCGASAPQQLGMLMVAKSLMTALQDWVGDVMADDVANHLGPSEKRRSKTAKKKPGPKKKPRS